MRRQIPEQKAGPLRDDSGPGPDIPASRDRRPAPGRSPRSGVEAGHDKALPGRRGDPPANHGGHRMRHMGMAAATMDRAGRAQPRPREVAVALGGEGAVTVPGRTADRAPGGDRRLRALSAASSPAAPGPNQYPGVHPPPVVAPPAPRPRRSTRRRPCKPTQPRRGRWRSTARGCRRSDRCSMRSSR